jgi:hypothetical protein
MSSRHLFWWLGLAAALVMLAPGTWAQNPRRVDVTEFGARPDSRANAVAAVQRALEAARGRPNPIIVFP